MFDLNISKSIKFNTVDEEKSCLFIQKAVSMETDIYLRSEK